MEQWMRCVSRLQGSITTRSGRGEMGFGRMEFHDFPDDPFVFDEGGDDMFGWM